jgi:hypothetical protein
MLHQGRRRADEESRVPGEMGVSKNLRVCILTPSQAAMLEQTGVVPRCKWHRHCSEKHAMEFCRKGEARLIRPAPSSKHGRPAIVPIARRNYKPTAVQLGVATVHGGPQLRVWQLVR